MNSLEIEFDFLVK